MKFASDHAFHLWHQFQRGLFNRKAFLQLVPSDLHKLNEAAPLQFAQEEGCAKHRVGFAGE